MSQTKPLKILKASAGSGKTFALTVHFIGLLLDRPESYREILALTFTNKATAEMKIRILGTLEMLAQQDLKLPDTAELASYHQAILKSRPHWRRDDIQQRADQAYRYILHDYSRFSVMTIDRFSQREIRSFTYELGLDSSFHIELNTTKVLQDLMNRLYDQLGEQQELPNWVMERIRAQIDSDKSWKIDRELKKLGKNIFKDDFKPLEEAALRPGNEDLFDRIAKHTKEKIDGFTQQSIQFTNQIADVIIQSSVKE